MSLTSLVEKVYFELEELAKIYNSIKKRVKIESDRRVTWKETSDLEALRGFIALCLQSYYSCLENVFKKIDDTIDGIGYDGEQWHKELLLRMSRKRVNRNEVVNEEHYEWLNDLRGFRHIVVHLYSHNLKDKKVKEQVYSLMELHEPFCLSLFQWIKPIEEELQIDIQSNYPGINYEKRE